MQSQGTRSEGKRSMSGYRERGVWNRLPPSLGVQHQLGCVFTDGSNTFRYSLTEPRVITLVRRHQLADQLLSLEDSSRCKIILLTPRCVALLYRCTRIRLSDSFRSHTFRSLGQPICVENTRSTFPIKVSVLHHAAHAQSPLLL